MKATAKVIEEDGKQTVFLPETIHLADTEVLVQQLGDAVLLVPRDKVWETFVHGVDSFPEDVFANGREPQDVSMEREAP